MMGLVTERESALTPSGDASVRSKKSPLRWQMGTVNRHMVNANHARGLLFALFVMSLVIASQPVHAQDVCSTLQQVVTAAKEDPPFSSVRYLNVPKARCSVGDYEQHLEMDDRAKRSKGESWLCSWYQADLDKLSRDIEKMEDIREDAFDTSYDALNEWMDAPPYSEARAEAEYRQAEAEYERVRAELSRLKGIMRSKSDALHSEVRTLLSSIQQCIQKNAIGGPWENIDDDVRYYSYSRGRERSRGRYFSRGTWGTCHSKPSTICLEIRADASEGLTTIEVYNANRSPEQ